MVVEAGVRAVAVAQHVDHRDAFARHWDGAAPVPAGTAPRRHPLTAVLWGFGRTPPPSEQELTFGLTLGVI